MQKILIQFAHPAQSRSNVNRQLRQAVDGLEGVTVNDLYNRYPDFMIDVEREQALCEAHDIIVFQHPFYWYSSPAIVKEWFDLVLEHDWAYGRHGDALKNKQFLLAISAGGDASTYHREGHNQFTIAELTSPYQATANLCGMVWLPPFAVTGVHRGLPAEKIQAHSEDYRRVLIALRDSKIDVESLKRHPFLNSDIHSLIKRP